MMLAELTPEASARALADSHIHKIGLECLQVFCTAAREMQVAFDTSPHFAPYLPLPKSTHEGHPLVLWAVEDRTHLAFLVRYAVACFEEYHLRFGKRYALEDLARAALSWAWNGETPRDPEVWCVCIESSYRSDQTPARVESLGEAQRYYQTYLSRKYRDWGDRARWSNRRPPTWMGHYWRRKWAPSPRIQVSAAPREIYTLIPMGTANTMLGTGA